MLSPGFYQRYQRSLIEPDWAIDLRHILIIYDLLSSGMFRHALEIGAHYGASTCAFVEAAEHSSDLRVTVCDSTITSVVRELVQRSAAAPRCQLLECDSFEALQQLRERRMPVDVALLDGSHVFYRNATEAALLRCLGTRTLLLHDICTTSHDRYGRNHEFDGPTKLLERLQSASGWFAVEDSKLRDGERTEGGFALVTRNREIWERAVEVFSAWTSLPKADLRRATGATDQG
ncbi:MAG: class I SAM-dependent methyltransferase [Bryobacteraceae bacterium]